MRKNLPVTQMEYEFPEEFTLLSATDTKGRITYANAAFVQVSGFTYEELQHKAHNIVRHPDVPPEAFQDLWNTLKAGRSWTAVIKNRRKNGDHYWVRANATPIMRNGEPQGYVSVRTRPSREEINDAERVFEAFASGRRIRRRFYQGQLIHTGWMRWRNFSRTASIHIRLITGVAALALALPALAWLAGLNGPALLAFTGAAWIVTILTAWWLDQQITRPLRTILQQALRISSGQKGANIQINRIDEIGAILRAINQSGLNLHSLVNDVHAQLSGLRSASSEISQGSRGLSSQSEHAADSLATTTQSTHEMSATIQRNAQIAHDAQSLAEAASTTANRAVDVMRQAARSMQEMDTASHKISDIVNVIDSIAFQTNILALNAAVEAARAGEQGRGFAVVASEVRALALRSATSAREIGSLIQNTVLTAKAGASHVQDASQAMDAILLNSHDMHKLIEQISRASVTQADGIIRVTQAFGTLDDLTRSNAAMAEESAQAVSAMDEQTINLAQAMQVFMGNRSSPPAQHAIP